MFSELSTSNMLASSRQGPPICLDHCQVWEKVRVEASSNVMERMVLMGVQFDRSLVDYYSVCSLLAGILNEVNVVAARSFTYHVNRSLLAYEALI